MKNKTKTRILNFVLVVGLLWVPVLSFAITIPGTPDAKTIPQIVDALLTPVWTIAFAIAVVMFIVGGIMFMTATGDANKLSQARSTIIWAVIGLAVAVMAFSLENVIGGLWGAGPAGGGAK
jgi:FtsH-binding integral membrane protein